MARFAVVLLLVIGCSSAPALPRAAPGPVLRVAGLQRPESVLYDQDRDRYLVSNINGRDPGFISVIAPDGTLVAARWIAGGANGIVLDDPHGSGIVDGRLYVADGDTVRMFDVNSGAPVGNIVISGATMLNDVATDPVTGVVFVSDTAMRRTSSGYEMAGTDAVYAIEHGVVRTLAKSADLHQPNGLAIGSGGVWVVDGPGNLYRLDARGEKHDEIDGPGQSLDGLVMVGNELLVSDWDSNAVYAGTPGGRFRRVVTGVTKPADIGFDTRRSWILVPRIADNVLEAYPFERRSSP